jgi:Bacterial Ig domain
MRGSCWRCLAWAVAWCCVAVSPVWAQVPAGSLRGVLGANKVDLLLQYLGTASSADGSPAARAVTVAMARKAIADARDIGFGFVRVMAAGYGPVAPPPAGSPAQNDLALWRSAPERYWSRVDAMFDDLDAAGIRLVPSFVWNPMQFPALANETVADLVANPASASRALLGRYVTEFIMRYRARKTILFYELTNELNLEADIDIRGRCLAVLPAPNCAAYGNFTSAQMTVFARAMVERIKALDNWHEVDSGYSLPRPSAYHLAAQPEFSPGGPDWTSDTEVEFDDVLARTGAPFEIWSVHIYPGDVRWGNPAGSEASTMAEAAAAARRHGKRLYLGEFGDSTVSPYLTSMLRGIGPDRVAYASVWVWEFYQQSTWQSADLTSAPPMSLEPGFSDAIDALLQRAAGGRGRTDAPAVRVVLTTPLPCTTLAGTADLYATASASGPAPVERVVFTVDGEPVGMATQTPFHVAYTPPRPGAHLVRATAYAGKVLATTQARVLSGTTGATCRVP